MRKKRKKHEHISDVLAKLSRKRKKTITYKEILQALGDRALGIAIVLFALPSALPFSAIPGVSFIFSLPIVFFSLQMLNTHPKLWLPKKLSSQEIETEKLKLVIEKTAPFLKRIERLLRSRWDFFLNRFMNILHGVVLLGLVLLLLLPIPFSNFIFALLIILFGLGIAASDGVVLAIAYFLTLGYVALIFNLTKGLISLFN